jgi:lipoprotein-anchoring transpeptidase ErfK/SrfK
LAVHGVVGSLVWTLLGAGAVLAALGGMFSPSGSTTAAATTLARADSDTHEPTFPRVPADSGTGRRIIFDQSDQRVWLVASDGEVQHSSLVTGSDRGNVHPGSYRVQSRTRYARAYNGSGRFEFFVRFTTGHKSAIGFHSVTVNKQGQLVHARADLGIPSTPGCVELWRVDAEVLWNFAPVGTPVVVTA